MQPEVSTGLTKRRGLRRRPLPLDPFPAHNGLADPDLFAELDKHNTCYRGESPASLVCVAESDVLATEVTDAGGPPTTLVPPDENYDHANFYYRMEILPPMSVENAGADTLTCGEIQVGDNSLRGYIVRITEGPGAGQEATITSNAASTITVAPPWLIQPDASSLFAVVEAGWQFAGNTTTSDIRFAVPNRRGSVIQIEGRAANLRDLECEPSLCFVQRWAIGGSAGGQTDGDIPPKPGFGFRVGSASTVEVSSISFSTLENTQSIHAGTLCLYYVDELGGIHTPTLSDPLPTGSQDLALQTDTAYVVGNMLQIDQELLQVLSVVDGRHYEVDRGRLGSPISAHAAGATVEVLTRNIAVTAFPKEFFGSPASSSFAWTVPVGSWRIAAAELYVTNSVGNSPTTSQSYTTTVSRGLRALPGGQYTMQVPGQLAIRSNCVPPVTVTESRSIRDTFATTLVAPQGAPIVVRVTVDDQPMPVLTILAGQTQSNTLDGSLLPPLLADSRLNVDILSVGSADGIETGRDLTVTIRL